MYMSLNEAVEQARLHNMSYGKYIAAYRPYEYIASRDREKLSSVDRLNDDIPLVDGRTKIPFNTVSDMYSSGMSRRDIAKELGVSISAVHKYIKRHHLTRGSF